jgi:uncharacterized protein YuzE
MIKINYDSAGDILELKFSEAAIKDSEYLDESGLVVDYDENGLMVGIEIIAFVKKVGKAPEVLAMAG